MAETDAQPFLSEAWRTALKSALGPIAAYLTPKNFGLSSFSLEEKSEEDEDFASYIRSKIDLSRAIRAISLIDEIGRELDFEYRHQVQYSENRIDGKLLVPRLIRERAAGRLRRIPVIRIERIPETPEALLASEALCISQKVLRNWCRLQGGAEAVLAKDRLEEAANLERSEPWAGLSFRPRPSIKDLARTVMSRTVAGYNAPGSAIDQLSSLMVGNPKAITEAFGSVDFLLSNDERFEDRLFELICLGWLIKALKAHEPTGIVDPENLRRPGPVFTSVRGNATLSLYYQAGHLSSLARYERIRTKKRFRAIPDFSLELTIDDRRHIVLLDAKNRSKSANSEVFYKLLGYRENLGLQETLGLAIAPSFTQSTDFDWISFGSRNFGIARVPLERGEALIARLAKLVTRQFTELADQGSISLLAD